MDKAVRWHREFNKSWEASLGFRIPVHATPCIECEGTGLVDIAIAPWRANRRLPTL